MEVAAEHEDGAATAAAPEDPVSKVLTEQQEQYKQQLLDLKKVRGALPEEMEKELQELMPAVQMPVLTHKHLNQLSKLEKSVSSLQKRIVEMDVQWQEFVAQANEKFNKHKTLYMQKREQMFSDFREKSEELNKLKVEISTASEGLQQKQVEESLDQVSSEVLASMMSQQQFKVEQMEMPCPYQVEGVWDVEDEEMIPVNSTMESDGTKKKTVAPFSRGVTSPTKVQQHNLKAKAHEARKKELEKSKDKVETVEANTWRAFWKDTGCGNSLWMKSRMSRLPLMRVFMFVWCIQIGCMMRGTWPLMIPIRFHCWTTS